MAFTIMPADAKSRRRLLILTGIAMIAAAGLFFSSRDDTSAVPAAAPPPAAVSIPQAGAATAAPADTELAATVPNNPFRDPFRPPPGYGRQMLAAAPPAMPAYVPSPSYGNSGSYRPPAGAGAETPRPAASLPASLIGIVSYNGERAAIINYGGQSRSYRTNDSVGPYRLSQIREDSVVLSGGGGTQVLRMRK